MSIDITQQALNALADAGLGNDSPAVRCFSDSGGASCDWEHIKLKDKQ